MRIALISDIHANDIALDAVLADIDRSGVDHIVCLGDVATLGPQPGAVLKRLRDLDCLCILGNHDDFVLRPELVHAYTEAPSVVEAVHWCHERITEEEAAFLRSFRKTAQVPLGDDSALFVYHGSPRSNTEDIVATTPPLRLDEMLDGQFAPVMAGGHTHVQMVRPHRGALVVNPGSVGLAFREPAAGKPPTILPHADYAIVEASEGDVHVHLRRIRLDPDELIASVKASDNPVAPYQAQQYANAATQRKALPR